jgi:hypothetical protein
VTATLNPALESAIDGHRIELAQEGSAWRALVAADPEITKTLESRRAELLAEHDKAAAGLAAAIAAHKDALAALEAAQSRHNAVLARAGRIAGNVQSRELGRLLETERQRYHDAQIRATHARLALSQLRWNLECLATDIEQLDGVLAPPPVRLTEVVKRPVPPALGDDFDTIVMPTAPRAA